MVANCAVVTCRNYRNRKNSNVYIKYFRFPKNKELLEKWISACGVKKKISILSSRICSDHFEENDYLLKDILLKTPLKKRHLKKGAYPSKNLPGMMCQQLSERSTRNNSRARKKFVEDILCEWNERKEENQNYDNSNDDCDLITRTKEWPGKTHNEIGTYALKSEEMCRICLDTDVATEELCYIFESSKEENLCTKMMKIADIQIDKEDSLPSFVCTKCVEKINSFLQFKQQIEDSNLYLKSLKVENLENKNNLNHDDEVEFEFFNVATSTDIVTEKRNDKMKLGHQINKNIKVEEQTDTEYIQIEPEIKHFKNSSDIEESESDSEKSEVKSSQTENNAIKLELDKELVAKRTRKRKSSTKKLEAKKEDLSIAKKSQEDGEDFCTVKKRKTRIPRFQCSICGKLLQSRARLEGHIRTHTGERPYKCTLCAKAFVQMAGLLWHMKSHDTEKRKRPRKQKDEHDINTNENKPKEETKV